MPRFHAWVELVYHRTVHTETGAPPLDRFQASPAPTILRTADPVLLRQAFLGREKRPITRTCPLSLQGNRYGVDPLLAGQQVDLRFDPFDLADVEIWRDGHFVAHAFRQPPKNAPAHAPQLPDA